MNLQTIPRIVINLPERTDRLGTVRSELGHLFGDGSFHLISGVIIPGNSMEGIAQAHKNAVSYAKASGFSEVLIMEDDISFTPSDKLKHHVSQCFNNLPPEWDLLLGGVSESDGLSYHNHYWNRTRQFCGLHFYIIPEHMYDIVLSYPGGYHIDRWLNMQDQYKCFVAKPMFAIQSPGYSDNTKRDENYTDIFSKFELLK